MGSASCLAVKPQHAGSHTELLLLGVNVFRENEGEERNGDKGKRRDSWLNAVVGAAKLACWSHRFKNCF